MKKIFAIATVATISSLAAVSSFADVTASSTATWEATATKDTKSALVVTPLKSLEFKYAEGLQSFNTQNGAFDVTIEGQSGATDFTLKSKVISNTLARTSDDSTLAVGVAWNGTKLSKSTEVTLIDTANNVNAGLENIANAYNKTGRTSAQGNFNFTVDSATQNGQNAKFSDLADGRWDGQVAVQFTANWVN